MTKEIADQLDSGMKCFYNTKTGELESYPDPDRMDDTEVWQDVMDKVDASYEDYVVFDVMGSNESFQVMASFVDAMPNNGTRNRLVHALQQRKPFQQFRNQLHDHPELLELWYKYKEQRYMEYVMDIAKLHNSEEAE